jgi:flagellar hook protein FlgE
MSITGSFYTGLSGLNTHGTAMGIIGDNISNVNTAGFKNSSAEFQDILGLSLSGVLGGNQTGAGSNVQSVDTNFVQGTFETTDVSTDLAVNGKGFFIVEDPTTHETFYTRAGHFHFDNEGYYVNSLGERVQGYLYNGTGTELIETLADIQINQNSMIAPNATSAVEMILNLDSSEATDTWDITDPAGSSGYSTPVTIYDTLGQAHVLEIYFTKTAANTWQWHAVIPSSDVTSGGGAGTYRLFGSGEVADDLEFSPTTGALTSPTTAVDLYDAANAIVFANGIAASAVTADLTETTQYGSESVIQSIIQDGYAAGVTSSVAIDGDGNITASYTNGQVKKIARLALSSFLNINGLLRNGSTQYSETVQSGQPLTNKAGEGGMGTISSSMLEESNVDLAGEIIKMIVIQRGYQANSKVISTTDEMLNTLIQLR